MIKRMLMPLPVGSYCLRLGMLVPAGASQLTCCFSIVTILIGDKGLQSGFYFNGVRTKECTRKDEL